MSDTPLTDAERQTDDRDIETWIAFAQGLERQLAEVRAEVAELKEANEGGFQQAQEERDKLVAEAESLRAVAHGLAGAARERVEAKAEYDSTPGVTCLRCGRADEALAAALRAYAALTGGKGNQIEQEQRELREAIAATPSIYPRRVDTKPSNEGWAIYWAAPDNEWVEGRWPDGTTQDTIYRDGEWWSRDECCLEHPSEWRSIQAAPPAGQGEEGEG